jgi:hypothetical protein
MRLLRTALYRKEMATEKPVVPRLMARSPEKISTAAGGIADQTCNGNHAFRTFEMAFRPLCMVVFLFMFNIIFV